MALSALRVGAQPPGEEARAGCVHCTDGAVLPCLLLSVALAWHVLGLQTEVCALPDSLLMFARSRADRAKQAQFTPSSKQMGRPEPVPLDHLDASQAC